MAQVRQDNVQIKLEIDGSQSRTELDNLTRKADVLREGMKGLKKGSEEYVAANKELGQVNTRMKELRDEIGLTSLTTNQLKSLSGQLNRELANLTPNTESFAAKAQELAEVDARLAQVRKDAKGVGDALDQGGTSFGDFIKKAAGFAGIQLGVEALVGSVKSIGQEIFNTTAKFETFEAVLTTALGSKSAAQEAMAQLSDLASSTPFSVEELTGSFVKFVNRGIVPSKAELQKLADVAASQGKSFDQLTEAVLDAGTGEFERLKEFGIQASKSGDQVSLSFKGVTQTVENTPQAITAMLESFGTAQGVMGSTNAIAQTLEGQVSNLGDTADQTAVVWGQRLRPVFVAVLSTIGFVLGVLKEVPGFVSENRGVLLALAGAVLTFNAAQLQANALLLYNAALSKGKVVWDTAVAASTKAWEIAQNGLNLALSANPIGAVIAVGTLLVGLLVTLYDKSEKFRAVVGGLGAAFMGFVRTLKDGVVQQLTALGDVLTGLLSGNPAKIRAGLSSLKSVYTEAGRNAATAFQQAYDGKLTEAQAQREARNRQLFDDAERAYQRRADAAAKARLEAEKKASLEALKNREAAIREALAVVASGSAEELRLKKLEVATKRDIELADEKKTEAERRLIKADAAAAIKKLQDDYNKKQLDAAKKAAAEQAAVDQKIANLKAALLDDETERRIQQLVAAAEKEKAEAKGTAVQIAEQRRLIMAKLAVDVEAERKKQADRQTQEELEIEQQRNALIKNEWERRAAELRTAAKAESLKVLDSDSQAAEKRRLIQEKLQRDLVQLEQDRVAEQREIASRIAAIDEDIALKRIERRRQLSNEWSQQRQQADADEFAVRKAQLDRQFADEYFQQGLNNAQKLAIAQEYIQAKEQLEIDADERRQQREKAAAEFIATQASTLVQTVADFEKIGSDKQLARLDKERKQREAKLDAEYKAGTISKESYEAQKAGIEQQYDQQTRQVKKQQAEKEKEFNIAQAIIAGILAVIKASPNPVMMALAGVTAAAGVAKMIATPIPEFEQGGVFGRAWRGVKQFARGGRINPRAGVADVGQRHAGGGIRMVDGATGEHLGEWERGEAYMILSRDTYANNRHLVDELIDTSLYRGGAPVRPRPGYYEDGGTFRTGSSSAVPSGSQGQADSRELVQLLRETRDAIRALPSRQYVGWDQDDTAELEQRLDERAADRVRGQVR